MVTIRRRRIFPFIAIFWRCHISCHVRRKQSCFQSFIAGRNVLSNIPYDDESIKPDEHLKPKFLSNFANLFSEHHVASLQPYQSCSLQSYLSDILSYFAIVLTNLSEQCVQPGQPDLPCFANQPFVVAYKSSKSITCISNVFTNIACVPESTKSFFSHSWKLLFPHKP